MSFPYGAVVVDSFTRADAANLGANWTVLTGDAPIEIYQNQAKGGASSSSNGELYNVASYGPDSACYLIVGSNPGDSITLFVRLDGVGKTNCYYLFIGGTSWHLHKVVSGVDTALTGSPFTHAAPVAGEGCGLAANGTTIEVTFYNGSAWSVVGSATDAGVSAAGYTAFETGSNVTSYSAFAAGTTAVSQSPPYANVTITA